MAQSNGEERTHVGEHPQFKVDSLRAALEATEQRTVEGTDGGNEMTITKEGREQTEIQNDNASRSEVGLRNPTLGELISSPMDIPTSDADQHHLVGRQSVTSQCGYGGECRDMHLLFEPNPEQEKNHQGSEETQAIDGWNALLARHVGPPLEPLLEHPSDYSAASDDSEVRGGLPHHTVIDGHGNEEILGSNAYFQTYNRSNTHDGQDHANVGDGVSENTAETTGAEYPEKLGLLKKK